MRGYFGVGLARSKSKLNVGATLRAANCFGASFVAVSGRRYTHAVTDTMKSFRSVPLFSVDCLLSVIPYACTLVAVEISKDATCLTEFTHPERAFYMFGPEGGTLTDSEMKNALKVSIPTSRCLNLSAAVNVVLYDRIAKAHGSNKQIPQGMNRNKGE